MGHLMKSRVVNITIRRSLLGVFLTAGLVVSLFGIYHFQQGPVIDAVAVDSTHDAAIILEAFTNRTIEISADVRKELTECRLMNIADCLSNRTVAVTLRNEGTLSIEASLKSVPKPAALQNDTSSYGNMTIEGGRVIELFVEPVDQWNDYVLYLSNHGSQYVPLKIEVRQHFRVRVFRYDIPFIWLRISFFGGMLSYLSFLLMAGPRIRYLVFGLFCLLCALTVVWFSAGNPSFASAIFADYISRVALVCILLFLLIIIAGEGALLLWDLPQIPLRAKFFPASQRILREEFEKRITALFNKIAMKGNSVLAHFFCLVIVGFSLAFFLRHESFEVLHKSGLFIAILLASVPSMMLLAYSYVLSYVEATKHFHISWPVELKYGKACMGSAVIFAVLVCYLLKWSIGLTGVIWKELLDSAILVVYDPSISLLTGTEIVALSDLVTTVLSFGIPIAAMSYYYSFVLLAKRRFEGPVFDEQLSESAFDAVVFVAVFTGALWLQYLVGPIDYDRVGISLTASFVFASFRNYLEALRP